MANIHSIGKDIVYVYGERTRRAVYQVEGENKFYIKTNGEFIEVYRITMGFSTTKRN
jgi:hypothetical protein